MAVMEDTPDPPVAQVLRWDEGGTHPRAVDLVSSGLLVAEVGVVPLPNGMCPECGWTKALGKTCVRRGGAGRSLEGVLQGVRALEGSAGRVQERCWKGF